MQSPRSPISKRLFLVTFLHLFLHSPSNVDYSDNYISSKEEKVRLRHISDLEKNVQSQNKTHHRFMCWFLLITSDLHINIHNLNSALFSTSSNHSPKMIYKGINFTPGVKCSRCLPCSSPSAVFDKLLLPSLNSLLSLVDLLSWLLQLLSDYSFWVFCMNVLNILMLSHSSHNYMHVSSSISLLLRYLDSDSI